jgi:uncharacterized protein YndB with AHSA1/START domain
MATPLDTQFQDATQCTVTSSRRFVHVRERVYAAFCDPAQLAQWWGPKDFTSTFETFELRADGGWRLVMHGPDGAAYLVEKRFLVVRAPEFVSMQQLGDSHRFQMDIAFEDDLGATRMAWRMVFESATELSPIKDFIAHANEENFDRLERLLAVTNASE